VEFVELASTTTVVVTEVAIRVVVAVPLVAIRGRFGRESETDVATTPTPVHSS